LRGMVGGVAHGFSLVWLALSLDLASFLMRCYVLMGVSGCGKTSVGQELARRLDVTFIDGDELHPPTNIEKMANGSPLNDDDREPWLADVGRALAMKDGPVVIGCSALKRIYRDWIREHAAEAVGFVHLHASKAVLSKRVNERAGHFMPPSLLNSQFATLELLEVDEEGCVVDIGRPLSAVADSAEVYFKETLG